MTDLKMSKVLGAAALASLALALPAFAQDAAAPAAEVVPIIDKGDTKNPNDPVLEPALLPIGDPACMA